MNDDLNIKRYDLREDILNMIFRAQAGHIGGDFSVCDILAVLYFRHMNIRPEHMNDVNRDHFIMSKGHSVEALYSVLAARGFFHKEDLETFSEFGTRLIGHPNNQINGIEMNSGSLGHGLPVAVGMALAGKLDCASYHVFVVMGDGELAEGSVWEGFMSAGHYQLDHLIAIIDRNHLQISGNTEDIMRLENLERRIEEFGWYVIQTDGNDLAALDNAITQAKRNNGKPSCIIANTVKGWGVSFMENRTEWHHKVPTREEYERAMRELEEKKNIGEC